MIGLDSLFQKSQIFTPKERTGDTHERPGVAYKNTAFERWF